MWKHVITGRVKAKCKELSSFGGSETDNKALHMSFDAFTKTDVMPCEKTLDNEVSFFFLRKKGILKNMLFYCIQGLNIVGKK